MTVLPIRARAEEVPEGLCGVRVPFEGLENYIDQQARALFEGDSGGLITYLGSELVHYADGHLPDSSNGDVLRLTIRIQGLGTHEFYADFRLLQTPFEGWECTTPYQECPYALAKSVWWERILPNLDILPCTPEQEIYESDHCTLALGKRWYTLGVPPEILTAIENEEPLPISAGIDQGCHEVRFEDCSRMNVWPDYGGSYLQPCASGWGERLAILCTHKVLEVHQNQRRRPGDEAASRQLRLRRV